MSDVNNTLPPDDVYPTPEPGPAIFNGGGEVAPAPETVPLVAAPEPEPEPAPPALPADHVKVELLHDVSVWIHGVEQAWVAGWQVVHKDVVALIKQTHQKSALRE